MTRYRKPPRPTGADNAMRTAVAIGGEVGFSINSGHLKKGDCIIINSNEVNPMGKPYDADLKQQAVRCSTAFH